MTHDRTDRRPAAGPPFRHRSARRRVRRRVRPRDHRAVSCTAAGTSSPQHATAVNVPPDPRRAVRPPAAPRAGPGRGAHRRRTAGGAVPVRAQRGAEPDGAWAGSSTSPVTGPSAWSGGSEPTSEVNPAAVAAMAEVGIDIAGEYPKPWTDEIVRAADVVITMGCGDACPIFPGKRYEDWELADPAGLGRRRRSVPSETRSAAGSGTCSPRWGSRPADRRPRRVFTGCSPGRLPPRPGIFA